LNKGAIFVLFYLLVIVALIFSACSEPAPTVPTTPTAPSAPAAPEVIKIGVVFAQNWPLGLDAVHMIEWDVARIAKAGGMDVGGKKYNFQIIVDDSKMDLNLAKTAGEKQIFQDNVKFMISDPWSQTLVKLCDDNEVVGVLGNYDVETHDAKLKWVVGGSNAVTTYPAFINWTAEHFPNVKTMVGCYPDRHDGRLTGELQEKRNAPVAGLKVLEQIYYPPGATDLSAVGTRIKTLNPDMLVAFGGGPPLDAGIMKAAYSAGWKGLVCGNATMPASVIMAIAGPEAVEGGSFLAWPAEFDPSTTPEAAQYKADYIAKYGKWDDPEYTECIAWYGLMGGLKGANSVDKSKVMEALFKGYQIVTPQGTLVRIPRMDLNQPKFTDAIYCNLPAKTIKGGKIIKLDTVTVEQQIKYMKAIFGAW
jgi:branched-chain amino acid transport system substrate-binding protein